jgi:serine/threonine protein kinase
MAQQAAKGGGGGVAGKKKLTHIGQYEIGRTLGEGSFSKVKLATDVFTGKKVSGAVRDSEHNCLCV